MQIAPEKECLQKDGMRTLDPLASVARTFTLQEKVKAQYKYSSIAGALTYQSWAQQSHHLRLQSANQDGRSISMPYQAT